MHPTVALFYRNFKEYGPSHFSHVGLGVNALHTAKVLRAHHIKAYPVSVWTVEDIEKRLEEPAFTHAIIDALWVKKSELIELARKYPEVHFYVRSHSQIGFLQVEPDAIKILRDSLAVQESEVNVHVAGNSARFKRFIEGVYNQDCELLPNLYHLERPANRPHEHRGQHRKIHIASFGSMRHLKMHSVAAAAALLLAQSHGRELEFHISVSREEHGAGTLRSIRHMFDQLPWAKLVEHAWSDWSDFRRLVAHMDLCIQVSATETFNLTTADAVAEGVPCVVSAAIEWLPSEFHADIDDAEQIAHVGWRVLLDSHAPRASLEALRRYMTSSIEDWKRALVI